jgi:hypothetical protein
MNDVELDQNWIDNYFNTLNNKIFSYIVPIEKITIFLIYLNNNETEYFYKTKYNINSYLLKDDLFNIIEKNKIKNNNYYYLKNLLKFELNLNQYDIKKFLDNEKFYKEVENINFFQDIYFNDNINIFKNLNSLILIFEKKISRDSKNITFKLVRDKHNNTKKSFQKKT